jgi:hypothetical protein
MKGKGVVLKLLRILVGACVMSTVLAGPINASQNPGETTVWTEAESPYVLKSDYVIDPDDTLIVEPGVTVLAEDGVRLVVYGVLNADGTPVSNVTFTKTDAAQSWAGIRFEGNLKSSLSYAKVMHARTALLIDAASPIMSDLTISENRRGVIFANPATDALVERTVFMRNGRAVQGKARRLIEIRSSDFWNNGSNVVAAPQGAYDCGAEGKWSIHGNDILRGPDDGYYSDDVRTTPGSRTSPYEVTASNNWWGSTDEEDIKARMSNGESGIYDQERKQIEWQPAASMPQTLWQPPGDVAQPAPEPISVADPGTISIIETPQHARCRKDLSLTAKGRGIGVIFPVRWVKVALVRYGADGCRWWHESERRLVSGSCGKKVWTRARGTSDWSHPFGRLPRGRYRLWSLSNGEGDFEPARNDNRFRIGR